MPPLNVCVQVNASGESSKSGVSPGEALAFATEVAAIPGLKLRGLKASWTHRTGRSGILTVSITGRRSDERLRASVYAGRTEFSTRRVARATRATSRITFALRAKPRRVIAVLLVGIACMVFGSLFLAWGDPAQMIAGASATEAGVLAVRAALGLDQPFWTQYGIYLKNLFSLNLGMSYITRQPILQEIAVRLPYTINLAVTAILLSTLVGIPLIASMGVAVAITVSVAVLVAITFLPALLGLCLLYTSPSPRDS